MAARLIIRNDQDRVILDAPVHPDTVVTVRLRTTGRQTETTVQYERRPE